MLDRPEYWMSAICIAKLWSVRGLYDKNSASCYCFSSDVMYTKYKRLVYTSLDLLARFCKINYKLVEHKKFGLICFPRICFPCLIYCDQEPLWLLNVIEDNCYFLGVHIRLSTPCKIKFTFRPVGLFANYFSLDYLAFPPKVTWMCSKVSWFVEYNCKFIVWFKL